MYGIDPECERNVHIVVPFTQQRLGVVRFITHHKSVDTLIVHKLSYVSAPFSIGLQKYYRICITSLGAGPHY